jgi:hypothetical protein
MPSMTATSTITYSDAAQHKSSSNIYIYPGLDFLSAIQRVCILFFDSLTYSTFQRFESLLCIAKHGMAYYTIIIQLYQQIRTRITKDHKGASLSVSIFSLSTICHLYFVHEIYVHIRRVHWIVAWGFHFISHGLAAQQSGYLLFHGLDY